MTEFKPYERENKYKCILSLDEALLIQTIRGVGYGQVTAHISAGNIARTEIIKSELSRDRKGEKVTISYEEIVG